MSRPTTKDELIFASTENFNEMLKMIEEMTEAEKTTEFAFDLQKKKEAHWGRDKNVRDVLIHLWEWHNLLLRWVKNNRNLEQGKIAIQFLEEGFTWKTHGVMNELFWKRNQNVSEAEALELLKKSHLEVMELLNEFTNEQLFQKGVYKWVGTSTLGSFFICNTSSHYNWAIKKLKAHKRNVSIQQKKTL